MCESGGSYTAENPSSSASGAYQIIDSTWNGYAGYSHASDAPPHVQDAKAAELWAGGAGRSHWVC
jgi:muramidase (phage lysozyme)